MYRVNSIDIHLLREKEYLLNIETPFCTFEWLEFLKNNQKGTPVAFELSTDIGCNGVFVGVIVRKAGIKILGSPFPGWLTPDMGFIRLGELDINEAINAVRKYAFSALKCAFIQIVDKNIRAENLCVKGMHLGTARVLHIDNSLESEQVLENFSKNGRRDVRAAYRKGVEYRQLPFDRLFAEAYYEQLMDVFEKQNLKPFYDLEKMYDLVDAFEATPERVLASGAFYEGKCIATVFSFGFGKWAYYVGAASYRDYQKLLPNEGLFWEFVKHWNKAGIPNIDMVGYRPYKLKYEPKIIEVPVIELQKYPFLIQGKQLARKVIEQLRKIRGSKNEGSDCQL